MDFNDFEQNKEEGSSGTYYATPRWNDFTIDDEKCARRRFSRFFTAAFVYMLVANIAAIAVELIISLVAGEGAQEIFNDVYFVWGLNVFAMYIVAFPIFYLIIRKMRSTVRAKEKMNASEFFKLFFVAEALMMVGSVIGNYLNLLIGAIAGHDITNSTSELIYESPIWLVFIVVVIIGPVIEELIFRKFLMDKLGMYGDRIAIVVSAVSFGIFHGNLYQLFYATLLGLVLAYVYSKTSSIVYPIVMHMLINFFGSVIPLALNDMIIRYEEIYEIIMAGGVYDETEYLQLTAVIGTYSLLELAMVIAGAVIIFRQRRRFFVSDRCEVLIPRERRASVMLANVGSVLFIALTVITMIAQIFVV